MENVEAQVTQLSKMADKFGDFAADAALKILLAVLIYVIGRFIIKKVLKIFDKAESKSRLDPTARAYVRTTMKAGMFILLVILIVAELGVDMSSVIAIIASCGVAVGLALQGALSNIAGGIMLLLFRPFNVGDHVEASGEEGIVERISLIYTVLRTFDNRVVSIPNGTLMNANITNSSSKETRRIDLSFNIAGDVPVQKVRATIMEVIIGIDDALANPGPEVQPVSVVTGGYTYAIRVWVRTENYWPVFNELMASIPTALNKAGIEGPAKPVKVESVEIAGN